MTVHRRPIVFGSMPTVLIEDIVRALAACQVGAQTTQQDSIVSLSMVHLLAMDLLFDMIVQLDPDQEQIFAERINQLVQVMKLGGSGPTEDELEPEDYGPDETDTAEFDQEQDAILEPEFPDGEDVDTAPRFFGA